MGGGLGMRLAKNLASRCNVSSICATGHTEDLVAMPVQFLCLWPESVLQEVLLQWRFLGVYMTQVRVCRCGVVHM